MAAIVRAAHWRPAMGNYVRERFAQFDPLLEPGHVVAQARDVSIEVTHLVAADDHRVLGDEIVGTVVEHALGQLAPVRRTVAQQAYDALCGDVADEARELFLWLRAQVLQHEGKRLGEVGIALQRHVAHHRLRIAEREWQRREVGARR